MSVRGLKARLVRGFFQGSFLLWWGVTVALLSLNGFVFYHNTGTLVNNDRLVVHTQDVLSSLNDVLTTINAAEAGERGYIITGEDSYLQPYDAAVEQIWPQVARVQGLTADDPQQQQRIEPLRALIAARFAEMQLTIALRRTSSSAAAARVVLSDRGKNLMDALRAEISQMKDTELGLLDRRTAESHNAAQVTTLTLLLATAANIALLGGLFLLIQRGITRKAQQLEERGRLIRQEQAARATAETALRALDTFLSLASHELRTPLTAISGSAQLLRRRLLQEGGIAEGNERTLDLITRQVERLNLLTEQLLDTSRLQAGQLSIQPRPLDLTVLVHQVVEAQATTTDHTLRVGGVDGPTMIAGDAVRLEQVLHNLVGNAIKYSPDGGPIDVRISRQGATVRVEVKDQGIGIPESAQAQLFQRFFRASNVSVKGIGGLGIGLYVVKEIVELHGGTVEVTSAEGKGSTFAIHLPLLESSVES